MKSIKTSIPDLGQVELREPTVAQIKPFMGLMSTDTQAFLVAVLDVIVFKDGKHIPDVTSQIGLSVLLDLMPRVTELLGFDAEGEKAPEGND